MWVGWTEQMEAAAGTRSSMSLLLSKSKPPVSSPVHRWVYLLYIFLYKTSCYALSSLVAPIPRALSRFYWHTLISFLLSSSHPSSSQFPCLSVNIQYEEPHYIMKPTCNIWQSISLPGKPESLHSPRNQRRQH